MICFLNFKYHHLKIGYLSTNKTRINCKKKKRFRLPTEANVLRRILMKFYKNTYLSFLRKPVHMESCCLSKCTNSVHKGKNIKQVDHYTQEPGRSMVEMLGVLAIIGVLSVGGIAGYSKAMMKQRINNTLDKISTIVARVTELQASNTRFGANANAYSETMSIETMAERYGFDCPSIITGYNYTGNAYCSLPIGGYQVYLSEDRYSVDNHVKNSAQLLITLNGIADYDMCIAFVNSKIYKYVPEEWYTIYGGHIWVHGRDSEGRSTTKKIVDADQLSQFEYGPTEELNVTDAADMCAPCKSSSYCLIRWAMF